MRHEKGIKFYDEIIDLILDKIENSFFVVHAVYLDSKMKLITIICVNINKRTELCLLIDFTNEEYSWFVGAIDNGPSI